MRLESLRIPRFSITALIYTSKSKISSLQQTPADQYRAERDYMDPTYCELSLTYALLFRPTSSRNLRRLQPYVAAGKDQNLPWHQCVTFTNRPIHRFIPPWIPAADTLKTLDINPAKRPTKNILSDSFFRCSAPPSAQIGLNISSPSRSVTSIAGLYDQHRLTSTPMHQILSELTPNYPEDLKFMITSVMEARFSEDMESFVHFPYFAPRLRRLKQYLDSREPRTLRELWVDRRDYRAWWMFWGGWLVGGSVLVGVLANVAKGVLV
jgi:hypothetical protein